MVIGLSKEERLRLLRTPLPDIFVKVFKKQGYRFVGRLAAYKPCHYFKTALTDRIMCYKYWFYGIPTHRCIQWTPVLECNLNCIHCWRVHRTDVGLPPFKADVSEIEWDDPNELIERVIEEYYRVLKGYNPEYRPKTDKEMWEDAMKGPRHLATSLDGEPLMYPYIDDLMAIAKKKGMTTFIVSNGTYPERLERMHTLPTQLYISVYGPDYKTWLMVTRPPTREAKEVWNRFIKTLELLPSLNTRKVFRITAVRNLNMINPEGYAKLIEIAEPDFVEVKGYSWLGYSRKRLTKDHVPSMEEIREFGKKLSELTGYELIDEVERARIVLLWNGRTPLRIHPLKYKNAIK